MKTQHEIIDIGVAGKIGLYSDAIRVNPGLRWLFTAGTPGLSGEKGLPADITGQAERAWENIFAILNRAGMDVGDIVRVTTYLTNANDIREYAAVRSRFLGDSRPASMLLVVPELVWPEILLEIEIVAAKST